MGAPKASLGGNRGPIAAFGGIKEASGGIWEAKGGQAYGKWVVKCQSRVHTTPSIRQPGCRQETAKRILETGCSRQDAECRIQARLQGYLLQHYSSQPGGP